MRGISEERLKVLFDDYQHKFLYSQLEKMYEPHAIMNILHMLVDECKELNAWQPIETAPKDKPVLIIFNDAYLEVARLVNGVWISNDGLDYCYGQDMPTHWQELPEDPKWI